MNDSEKHFEHTVNLARDALKALLLVNGGAATALVALMDKTSGSKDYTSAIILFGAGAVFSVVSACFGYFSQLYYANHRMETENCQDAASSYARHRKWQTAAIITVVITLICMVAGIATAAYAARA